MCLCYKNATPKSSFSLWKWQHDGYTIGIPWIYHRYTMDIPWVYHGQTVSQTHPQPPNQQDRSAKDHRAQALGPENHGPCHFPYQTKVMCHAAYLDEVGCGMIRTPKPVAESDFMQVGSQKIQKMDGKCCKKISKQHVFCGTNWDATTCDKVVFWGEIAIGWWGCI